MSGLACYIKDMSNRIGKSKILLYCFLTIIFYVLYSLQPYFIPKIFTDKSINYLYVLGVVISFLSTSILSYPNNWMLQMIRKYSKQVIWEKNLDKEYVYFINKNVGEYQNLISEISFSMRSIQYESFQSILQSLILFFVYTILLLKYDIRMGLLYFLFYSLYMYLSVIFSKDNKTGIKEVLDSSSNINSFTIDFFKNIDTIFSMKSINLENNNYNNLLDSERKAYLNLQKKIDFSHFFLQVVVTFITIILLVASIKIKELNNINYSIILILIYSAFNLSGFGKQFLSFLENKSRLNLALIKIGYNDKYIYNDVEIIDSKSDIAISLENLTFCYEKEKLILNEINLNINYLDKILIMGPNGSGKSTLGKIIANILYPSSGKIKYNKKYIKNILDISYYSQSMSLFDRSIYENIIYPRERCDIEDINEIISLLKLDTLIKNKEDLFEKTPGDFGSKFSGGEKQKILIARSILNKKPIIIYDEINSALDTESVDIFNNLISSELEDCTVIMISHRNEGILNFNKTYKI